MNFKLFALVGIFLIGVLSEPANAARLEQGRMDDRPNYVVIGAFRVYKNAIRFTAHAHKDLKMDAKFELNPHRKLYYVYVLSTADQSLAINEAKRLREESEFRDTWVYFGALGERAAALGENYIGQDINPVTTQKIDNIKIEVGSEEKQDGAPEGASNTAMATSDSIQTVVSDEKPQILDETTGKNFLFKVFRTDDSTAIDG